MAAYIIRRILFMIPTIFGIMLVSFVVVQFAPGGPVERVIAQLSGSDTGATSRISGSRNPRVVTAGDPKRMPLGFIGGLVSKGIALRLAVIPAFSSHDWASLPRTPFENTSTSSK